MTPDQLTAASFASYPPEARQFAVAHLALLQQLPIAVAPAFLREIIVFDWRFPAERRTFEQQCVWLESLTPEHRGRLLAPFRQITMPATLAAKDWVGSPQSFLEQLTAYLWSSSRIRHVSPRRAGSSCGASGANAAEGSLRHRGRRQRRHCAQPATLSQACAAWRYAAQPEMDDGDAAAASRHTAAACRSTTRSIHALVYRRRRAVAA